MSSNGGGMALLGAPVKRFAGRRFVNVSLRPGISVLPKRNGGAPKSNPTKLSAQQSGPTHVRVFGDFSANPPPSP
jgi:hypothetical protein